MDAQPGARWPRPVPLIGDRTSAAERAADPRAGRSPRRRRARCTRSSPRAATSAGSGPTRCPPELLRGVLDGRAPRALGRALAAVAVHRRHRAGDPRPGGADGRPRTAAPGRPARARTAAPGCSTCSWKASAKRRSGSSSPATAARRRPACSGRATFPDTDLWSCACAIENIWLAARAAGLGVGWVTLFQPGRARRAAAPARRRRDPRLALPRLAGRAAARARPGAARLVAAARRWTTSCSPSAGRATASRAAPASPPRRARPSTPWSPRATPATICSPPRSRSACSTRR